MFIDFFTKTKKDLKRRAPIRNMVEFNPDGSIKLPSYVLAAQKKNQERLNTQKCIQIEKRVINFSAPKKCRLTITLSPSISDKRFIENIYADFKEKAAVPTKLIMINDKEFEVEVGTDFRRCTDCCNLVNRYREFLDGNLIEKKGNCTFEGRMKNFSFEDYFD